MPTKAFNGARIAQLPRHRASVFIQSAIVASIMRDFAVVCGDIERAMANIAVRAFTHCWYRRISVLRPGGPKTARRVHALGGAVVSVLTACPTASAGSTALSAVDASLSRVARAVNRGSFAISGFGWVVIVCAACVISAAASSTAFVRSSRADIICTCPAWSCWSIASICSSWPAMPRPNLSQPGMVIS